MRLKIIIVIMAFMAISARQADCDELGLANSLFYQGNASYSQEDYKEAIVEYEKALDIGYESGPLYYNLGNAYFKSGALGKAILNYLRAERLMPNDADLKSNLNYAKALIKNGAAEPERNWLARIFYSIADIFSLDGSLLLCAIFYFIFASVIAASIILKSARKKMLYISSFPLVLLILFLAVFIAKFNKEIVQKEAVVTAESQDAKFEPFDDATTFFVLSEGESAVIIAEKESWVKARRLDGKQGWLKRQALEAI